MFSLSKIEEELLVDTSLRDRYLYGFLIKNKKYCGNVPSNLEDRLCYFAFCQKGDEAGEILKKIRSEKPVKEIHYSKNLVVLIAAAIHECEVEEDSVTNYLSNNSLKEQFIVNEALKKNYMLAKNLNRPIDRLIIEIEKQDSIQEIEKAIENVISEIHDIYDYYILRKGISILHRFNEVKENVPQYLEATNFGKAIFLRLNIVLGLLVVLPLLYLAIIYLPKLISFVLSNWNEVEPVTFLLGLFVSVVVIFISAKKLLSIVIRSYFVITYKCMGLDFIAISKSLGQQKIQRQKMR